MQGTGVDGHLKNSRHYTKKYVSISSSSRRSTESVQYWIAPTFIVYAYFWLRQEPKEGPVFINFLWKAVLDPFWLRQEAQGVTISVRPSVCLWQSALSSSFWLKSSSNQLAESQQSIIRAFHLESHPSEPKILRLVWLLMTSNPYCMTLI